MTIVTIGTIHLAAAPGAGFDGYAFPCSVAVLPTGKLLATFTRIGGGPGVGIGVYSADGGATWSAPAALFDGVAGESFGDPCVVVAAGRRVETLCVSLRYDGVTWDLSRTRLWRRTSEDGGETFGPLEELPRHKKYYVGMTNAGIRLRDGALALGYSWDKPAEAGRPADGEGTMDLVCGVLLSRDEGQTWTPGGDCWADTGRAGDALGHATNGLDEPAVVELPNGDLFLLARTGTNRLWQSWSRDGGLSWETPAPSPLISHNCPPALLRLADGAVLCVYNNHPTRRFALSACLSTDGCRTWSAPRRLALPEGSPETEAAYPVVCQLADGTLTAVYYVVDRGAEAATFSIWATRFGRGEL